MNPANLIERIEQHGKSGAKALETFLVSRAPDIARLAQLTVDAFATGNKVIVLGNGGSAADAQHLAAELMGRYLTERNPLPAIALTTNSSSLTAIGNDYGFDVVFERQLRGIAAKGDVVIGISTSGNSENVLRALDAARCCGCVTVGLTGEREGTISPFCDHLFKAPTSHTPNVQECHIAWIHAWCDCIDQLWDARQGDAPGGYA